MRAVFRVLLSLVAVLPLTFAAPAPTAQASTADDEIRDCAFQKAGMGHGECQHFLRNPAGATDDPCWCDKCRNAASNQHHDGKTFPPGWNADLFERGGMDAYLKRHSVAWGITCSECFQKETPWPDGKSDKEPGTAPAKDWAGRGARDTVLKRLQIESRLFSNSPNLVLAYSKHFYVASDITGLKVRMPSGSARLMTTHEWVHLMIERAEFGRREWERNLGPLMTETQKPGTVDPILDGPMAIFFTEKQKDYERISSEYFKAPANKGLKGAGALMCGGMALTGMGGSKEKVGDDHELTAWMRHRLGHNLLSLWGSWATRPKSLPVWMDEGVAHWLTKSIEQFRNDAVFCVGEGATSSAPSYNEKDWDKDVAKWVNTTGKLGSIDLLLGKTVVNDLSEEDIKRSWSYFDFCLAEWREPFVKMLRDLRNEKDVRESFVKNFGGLTPEQFDERWRARVAGKIKLMTDDAPGGAGDAGAQDRKLIKAETDAKALASRVRQLGEIKDKKTIPVVVDVIAKDMDLPRETAFVTLLKVKDAECREALWTYGLGHPDGVVRAYVARLCGRLGLEKSKEKLNAQLEDPNWYARAEAAVALGMLKDVHAMGAMRKMADTDASEKARIGGMDALAMFKGDAASSVSVIAKSLDHAQWQIRIAAAQTLGEIGSMEGVEPLIARFEKEPTGRIADDVYEALKKISRDDLGRKPANWRKWWDKAKADTPGGLPSRPDEKPKPKGPDPNDPHATHDGGPPPYFGVEIYCNRIAFICDTSDSMNTLFTPDPSSAKSLSRDYVGRDKLSICKSEVRQALSGLDPRAHFNIVTFGTSIRSYNANPVAATAGNIDSACSWLDNTPAAGETNYYDALKAALDIGDKPDTNPDFKATPDTITFLTDGEPTKGDILDAEVLIEWYTGLNRYARVKTHTITFGLVNVDMPLLHGIATRNGGKFVLVAELRDKKRK